jgi:hypothetical protein
LFVASSNESHEMARMSRYWPAIINNRLLMFFHIQYHWMPLSTDWAYQVQKLVEQQQQQNVGQSVSWQIFAIASHSASYTSQSYLSSTLLQELLLTNAEDKVQIQGWTEKCGHTGQANNLAPLQTDILGWGETNFLLTFTFHQLIK